MAGIFSKERVHLDNLFRESRDVIASLNMTEAMANVSWPELGRLLKARGDDDQKLKKPVKNAQALIDILRQKHHILESQYEFDFERLPEIETFPAVYIRYGGIFLTPGMASMFDHCRRYFQKAKPDWEVKLLAGYRSPAYQLYLLSKEKGTLSQALRNTAPPYYSRHQLAIPDIKIRLIPNGESADPRIVWPSLGNICQRFGLTLHSDQPEDFETELRFPGIKNLYQVILSNELIPEQIAADFEEALIRAGFYPSPEGLQVIFALSAQESTIQWNPRLNESKKSFLNKRFYHSFASINSNLGESVAKLFLPSEYQQQKRQLIEELERITDPEEKRIREYDVYLWTRKTHRFLKQILIDNKQIGQIGQWFFELRSMTDQLFYEPQTFGLWQINVNHLLERIIARPRLRRRFPELFYRTNGEWKVSRNWLVDALSGVRSSPLNRQKTIELIVRIYLKPRYLNHLHGDKDDMLYFIAENMGGEMSTFRTAVQYELNRNLGSTLRLDGDLTYYLPHSIKIDWSRQSNSYIKLMEYIGTDPQRFNKPMNVKKLIDELCRAENWQQLKQSELYQHIMSDSEFVRRYPEIKSELYQQTPLGYAKKVMKKALLFK